MMEPHLQLAARPDRRGLRNGGLRYPMGGLPGYGRLGGGLGEGMRAGQGALIPRGGFAGAGPFSDPYSRGAHLHPAMAGRRNPMMRSPLQAGMFSQYNAVDPLMMQSPYLGVMGRPPLNKIAPGYGAYGGYNPHMGMNRFGVGGACDGQGCRGGLGCGDERRCEHNQCMYDNCSSCSNGSHSSSLPKDVKTKDIMIRGKTYSVRKSFLAEAGKFEADIGKYLEKKSEETVPTNVVEMLIDFINLERCSSRSLNDLVTLHVLASNLSVKSVQEHALGLLKKHEEDHLQTGGMTGHELVGICSTVLLSSKVDDKLTEWLEKLLNKHDLYLELGNCPEYLKVIATKPELEIEIMRLLGLLQKDDNVAGLRIL